MSSNQLPLPAAVNEVVFSLPPHSNDFLAVLSDFRVVVFSVVAGETDTTGKSRGVGCLPVPRQVGMTRYGIDLFYSGTSE